MSFIELHPEFTKLVKELARIANALERICLANNIPLVDTPPTYEIDDIQYSSDEDLLRREVQETVDKLKVGGGSVVPPTTEEDE